MGVTHIQGHLPLIITPGSIPEFPRRFKHSQVDSEIVAASVRNVPHSLRPLVGSNVCGGGLWDL